jgi:TolA-binding protein
LADDKVASRNKKNDDEDEIQDELPQAKELIAEARAQMASGSTGKARATLEEVVQLRPGRSLAAEARSPLAECAMIDGKRRRAVSLYLEVANRYKETAAGQNALFAAARIEANAGRKDAAKELLERYLDRYPKGRFSKDASKRLERLP